MALFLTVTIDHVFEKTHTHTHSQTKPKMYPISRVYCTDATDISLRCSCRLTLATLYGRFMLYILLEHCLYGRVL